MALPPPRPSLSGSEPLPVPRNGLPPPRQQLPEPRLEAQPASVPLPRFSLPPPRVETNPQIQSPQEPQRPASFLPPPRQSAPTLSKPFPVALVAGIVGAVVLVVVGVGCAIKIIGSKRNSSAATQLSVAQTPNATELGGSSSAGAVVPSAPSALPPPSSVSSVAPAAALAMPHPPLNAVAAPAPVPMPSPSPAVAVAPSAPHQQIPSSAAAVAPQTPVPPASANAAPVETSSSAAPSGPVQPPPPAPSPAPVAPVNAGYPPSGGTKTPNIVIAPDGTFRLEEWITQSPPVNGVVFKNFQAWVVGNDGSAAPLAPAVNGNDPNTGNSGTVIFPSFYSISPDGKYIFRSRKIAAGLGGAYLYTRQQGVNYELTDPGLYFDANNFFAVTTKSELMNSIVEFSRWLPDGRVGVKIRGSTPRVVSVAGWECIYDPASEKFSFDNLLAASNAAAIVRMDETPAPPPAAIISSEPATAPPAMPPPAPESPPASELDPAEALQNCVTEYSNGQVALNDNFANNYQGHIFRYSGVVVRHNASEGLVIFKGGGMLPYNWDLQVKARLRDYPVGERAHIYIKLTAIKYFPFAGWSFRGYEVDQPQ